MKNTRRRRKKPKNSYMQLLASRCLISKMLVSDNIRSPFLIFSWCFACFAQPQSPFLRRTTQDRVVLELVGTPLTHRRFLRKPSGTYGLGPQLGEDFSMDMYGYVWISMDYIEKLWETVGKLYPLLSSIQRFYKDYMGVCGFVGIEGVFRTCRSTGERWGTL